MRLVRYSYPSYRSLAPVSGRFSSSPWSGLETEIDRLFASALNDLAGVAASAARVPVNLYEDKDNTYVRAQLPGVNRDDISVEVVDGYLNIAAVRKTPAAEGQAEQTFTFNRSLQLKEEVQADKVAAAYENGVLTVTLPKREEAKPKKITVAVK
jgi:HSP20 family protein